jgi:hypothetical protein
MFKPRRSFVYGYTIGCGLGGSEAELVERISAQGGGISAAIPARSEAELVERISAQGGGISAAIPAKTANIVARSIAMMSSSEWGASRSIARLMFTL